MQQERRKRGRPKGSGAGRTMEKVHVTMPPQMRDWAMQQPGGLSAVVRRCLESMQQKAAE